MQSNRSKIYPQIDTGVSFPLNNKSGENDDFKKIPKNESNSRAQNIQKTYFSNEKVPIIQRKVKLRSGEEMETPKKAVKTLRKVIETVNDKNFIEYNQMDEERKEEQQLEQEEEKGEEKDLNYNQDYDENLSYRDQMGESDLDQYNDFRSRSWGAYNDDFEAYYDDNQNRDEDYRDNKDDQQKEKKESDLDNNQEEKENLFKTEEVAEKNINKWTFSREIQGKRKKKDLMSGSTENQLLKTDTLDTELQKKRDVIKNAVNARKKARFVAYFLYLAILGATMEFCFTRLIEKGIIEYPNFSSFEFNLENCSLYISDHTDMYIASPVYVKYNVPRRLTSDRGSEISIETEENLEKISVKNIFEPRYCQVDMFVMQGVQLESLKINCSRCNVTQANSFQLEVNKVLTINGQILNANFQNIKVKSLAHKVITGFLQLNNIEASSATNTITVENEGDIIIQSTQDFTVDLSTPTQTFCFKAPAVVQNSTECAVSGQNSTENNRNSTTCKITSSICSSSECSPTTKYTISSNISNVYANQISSVKEPVADEGQLVKGYIYDQGLGFSSKADEVLSNFNALASDQTKINPFVMLNLGDYGSRSSRYVKWVISSAPSYSYMKPWWISTMSATGLKAYTEEVDGFLFPGLCPFIPEYTTENLFEVQNLIAKKVNLPTALITFVNDDNVPLPSEYPQPSSGIFSSYGVLRDPFDKWLSLIRLENGDIILENNAPTKKWEILAAIIVSLLLAAFISFLLTKFTLLGVNRIYLKLATYADHFDSYTKLGQTKSQRESEEKEKEKEKKVIKNKEPFDHLPSPSAFIDYLSLILYRQWDSSVVQFYRLLFKEMDKDDMQDSENQNTDMLKGTDVKILYEKFCFINHLNEEKLINEPNLEILKEYGFDIITREDITAVFFTKINIKNYNNFLVGAQKEGEKMDSLEIYFKENVDITEFEEDQVEEETFIKLYHSFCDYNKLPSVVISHSAIKEKFNINISVKPQQFIMRIEEEDIFHYHTDFSSRIQRLLGSKTAKKKKKIYVIDTSNLENNFKLVTNQLSELSDKQLEKAKVDLILYPKWWLLDGITVLLQILVWALITVPMIGLIIINESEYQPWSLKEPRDLITYMDIVRDPANLMNNLYSSFSWNICIMFIVTQFWVNHFLEIFVYYAYMEFPQDKSFKSSKEKAEIKIVKDYRKAEWAAIIFALMFYYGYLGLVLAWLLLGALINPNAFLPYASAGVTFIMFVTTKYRTFKNLSNQGTKAIMDYLKSLFDGLTNKLLGKLAHSMEQVATSVVEKGKSLMESNAFKSATGKLAEVGIIDAEYISEYTEKIKNLDGKTIVAGAAIVAADPENLVNSLKEKTIEKVKEEYEKRGIPASLVSLVISIALKDNNKVKENLIKLLKECNAHLKKHEQSIDIGESVDIVVELLFPQGLNKEEFVMFLTTKIVKLIFDLLHLNKIEGLTPELLISTFNNFKNLQDLEIDTFIDGLKVLLMYMQKISDIKELEFFLPALDIASVVSQNGRNFWKLKNPALKLLSSINILLSQNGSSESPQLVEDFLQFLSIVLSDYEVPCNIKTTQPLENQEIFNIINNLNTSLGLSTICRNMGMHEKFISTIIYFAISYTRQEIDDLPYSFIKDLEEVLDLKAMSKNNYLPFCFDLVNLIFNPPMQSHVRIKKCVSSIEVDKELKDFLKILGCYSLKDFRNYYGSLAVEKNEYFLKMAEIIKINPIELLGIIDFMYNKQSSQRVDDFFIAILNRMSSSTHILDVIKPVIDLCLSEDESELLKAINALHLDHGQFLLMSKRILNPKFISEEDFNKFGINNKTLISDKEIIAGGSDEDTYENWKEELRDLIIANLSRLKSDVTKKATGQKQLKAVELVKFYLMDWKTCMYSNENVTSLIDALDNVDNKLKDKLESNGKGSSYKGINFLVTILSLKDLRLDKGKKFHKFDMEKDNIASSLANYLSVETEALKHCLRLFLVDDIETVLKSFLFFFPTQKGDQEVLKKVLRYSFKQVGNIKNQIDFISSKLPKSIKLPIFQEKNVSIPKSLFTQIFYGGSEGSMTISDLLELADLMLKNLIPKSKYGETLPKFYRGLYMAACFAKGFLTENDISKELGISDKKILKLLCLLTQSDERSRLSALMELIEDRYHLIKVLIAFYGLFTRKNFKINDSTNKHYLANLFNVPHEALDIFELGFERNVPNFLQKAIPLVKKISNSSVFGKNWFESLFSLSIAENFNVGYLANRLGILPEVIEFFITLTRLTISRHARKKELSLLTESIPVQKVLTKLNIKPKELLALARLVFNFFETDADFLEIFSQIGLVTKNNNSRGKEIIDMTLFRGFTALNRLVDLESDISKLRERLKKEKTSTERFFNSLGLSTNNDIAFIMSNLAAGNFLVLDEYKQKLDWAFSNDPKAEVAIKNLTMGICGLMNPNITVNDETDDQVKNFVEACYPKDQTEFFREIGHDQRGKVQPNNSLAYAIYLTYYSINIPPCWTQIFFLDRDMLLKVTKELPDIKEEFLLSLVLGFGSLPELIKDYLGLINWHTSCSEFYSRVTGEKEDKNPEFDFDDDKDLYKFFFHQLNFEYERTLKLAKEFNLSDFYMNRFDLENFYSNINCSLLYLLTIDKRAEEKEDCLQKVLDDLTKPVDQFLSILGLILSGKTGYKDRNEEKEVIGKMIKRAVVACYQEITKIFYPVKQRYSSFELTDLSILGTIFLLRSKPNMTYDRMLCNIHQLTMNIERKVYLDENFSKMSKFKLMKLAGISFGVQISNIVEWCLPPSLFTNEYTTALAQANSSEERKKIKAEQCLEVALNYMDDNNIVADLGLQYGNYSIYFKIKKYLCEMETRELTQTCFDSLYKEYLGNPQQDGEPILTNAANPDMFGACKTQNNRVYYSRELVSMLYDPYKDKNNTFQVQDDTIDIKTGISFADLEKKTKEFEEILTNPKMNLIQGIIRGDVSIFLKGNHVVLKGDLNKDKAKIYMALLGFISSRKNKLKDQKKLKEYLSIIAPFLESDLLRLEELLNLFITKRPILNDCAKSLELNENIVDLMLISLTKKSFSNDSLLRLLRKSLSCSEKELKALEIIRNVYQLEQNSGWLAAVKELVKDSDKKKNNHNFELLIKLIMMIDFKRLKKESHNLSRYEIYNFFKVNPRESKDCFAQIFEQIILGMKEAPTTNKKERELLIKSQQVIQCITSLDLPQLFSMIVLEDGGKINLNQEIKSSDAKMKDNESGSPMNIDSPTFLEKMLDMFGIDLDNPSANEGIRLFKVLLTLANRNLSVFKAEKSYKHAIENVTYDMVNSMLPRFIKDQKIQEKVARLILGVLTWDLELILSLFITEQTSDEASFLYHIVGCLRLDKVISMEGKEAVGQIKSHLGFLLSAISNKTSGMLGVILKTKGTSERPKKNEILVFKDAMKKLLLKQSLDPHKKEAFNPLLNYIFESMRNIEEKKDQLNRKEPFEHLLSIMIAICDGTILSKLINMVQNEKLRKFLIALVQFILKLVEKLFMSKGESIIYEEIISSFERFCESLRQLGTLASPIDKVLEYFPDFLKIFLAQRDKTVNGIKFDVLDILQKIISEVDPPEKFKILMYGLLSLILGIDAKEKSKPYLGPSQKMNLFFSDIIPALFPGLPNYMKTEHFERIYHLILKLRTGFLNNFKDPQKLRETVKEVVNLFSIIEPDAIKNEFMNPEFIKGLISLLDGDFEGIKYIMPLVVPGISQISVDKAVKYLGEVRSLLGLDFGSQLLKGNNTNKDSETKRKKMDEDSWAKIMEKIKEGTASSRDLFKVIDETGDQSGSISQYEFGLLATRLGIKLTKHRIREIFALVKRGKAQEESESDLNEKEFEQALEYLQNKNLQQALQMLGITPEMLTAILIWLAILLVLIFIFIFFGIKAFALGGTFGSIVNSIFPATGGIVLAKQRSDEGDKVSEENVKEAAEIGFGIIASDQI